MDWGGPSFVIAIIAISTAGWIINNWIRAKHGYDLEDEWGGKTTVKRDDAETKRLKAENRELHDKLDAMQDRMIVLEKIVTDRGYTLAEEIEALRDVPAPRSGSSESGVPLDLGTKKETSA
ncbi:hypothetical protein [Qipengyuania nanhaisediminis]|uniref:hypothetical protein n=1 Tax=Qipengyuania nanhaisediminis TaxID=604088 RepID=UPI0038B378A5